MQAEGGWEGLDKASLAIGPGLRSGRVGPGRVAQVASPGSPKKPEIKPEELSLLLIKSQDITHLPKLL